MNVLKSTLSIEAEEKVSNLTYKLFYEVVDGKLAKIYCPIYNEMQAEGGYEGMNTVQVGYISKENGQVTSSFNDLRDAIAHYQRFAEFVDEIEDSLN